MIAPLNLVWGDGGSCVELDLDGVVLFWDGVGSGGNVEFEFGAGVVTLDSNVVVVTFGDKVVFDETVELSARKNCIKRCLQANINIILIIQKKWKIETTNNLDEQS